jgi:hypothetical protein
MCGAYDALGTGKGGVCLVPTSVGRQHERPLAARLLLKGQSPSGRESSTVFLMALFPHQSLTSPMTVRLQRAVRYDRNPQCQRPSVQVSERPS